MKKVLFLTSIVPADKSQAAGMISLTAELREKVPEADFSFGALADLEVSMVNGKPISVILQPGDLNIRDFDLVIFRLWHKSSEQAIAVAKYLRHCGIGYIDGDIPQEGLSKYASLMTMFLSDISVPSTVFASRGRLKEIIASPNFEIPFPLVIKDIYGCKGRNNFLAESIEQAHQLIESHPGIEFIVQLYVPSPIHYRLMVLGGKTRFIVRHSLQPLAYGKQTSFDDDEPAIIDVRKFPFSAIRDAEKICRIKGIDVAGVDVILDDGGNHYLLEVNPAPQLDTRHFSEEKTECYLTYIKTLIGKQKGFKR